MIRYPCGVMVMGQRLVCHAPPINEPVTPNPPWEIHSSGRSVSRFLRAREQCRLTVAFTETWKIGTISCLGPCVIVRVVVPPFIVYPYPQPSTDDGSLYVIADRILEATHRIEIEVECRPELFMLERDDEGDQRPGFVDAKGIVHADP